MLPNTIYPNGPINAGQLLIDNYRNSFLQEMQYNKSPSTGSIFIFSSAIDYTNELDITENTLCADPEISIAEQLQFLMNIVGLNISQLSDLLKVGRPSIYKWLDGAEIRRGNLSRLEELYYLFTFWKAKRGVRLSSYLYKKIDDNLSLYDLLTADVIDVDRAKELSIKLNRILLGASDRAAQRRKKLEDAGFKKVNKDQKNKVLNSLVRKA